MTPPDGRGVDARAQSRSHRWPHTTSRSAAATAPGCSSMAATLHAVPRPINAATGRMAGQATPAATWQLCGEVRRADRRTASKSSSRTHLLVRSVLCVLVSSSSEERSRAGFLISQGGTSGATEGRKEAGRSGQATAGPPHVAGRAFNTRQSCELLALLARTNYFKWLSDVSNIFQQFRSAG